MRDAVLRSHRWNFGQARKALTLGWQAMTSVANSSGLVQVTKASHGLTTGDRIQVKSTSFSDGTWVVTVSSTSVFTLDSSVWSSGVVAGSFVLADSTTLNLNRNATATSAQQFTTLTLPATGAASFDWTPQAGSLAASGGLATFTGNLATAAGTYVTGTAFRGAAAPGGAKWWSGWTVYYTN
jgi:hypothetical protein